LTHNCSRLHELLRPEDLLYPERGGEGCFCPAGKNGLGKKGLLKVIWRECAQPERKNQGGPKDWGIGPGVRAETGRGDLALNAKKRLLVVRKGAGIGKKEGGGYELGKKKVRPDGGGV